MRHKGIFIASFIHSESTSPTTVPQALCTARGFCFIWVNNEPRSRHHLMQLATNTNYAQKSYHQKWVDKQQQKTHLIRQLAVLPILWMGCKRPFDSLRRVKLLWPFAQNVHLGKVARASWQHWIAGVSILRYINISISIKYSNFRFYKKNGSIL